MGINAYLKVKNERDGKVALRKHIEDKQICIKLKNLIQSVFFCPRGAELPTLEEVETALKEISFRKHVKWIGHGAEAL